MNTADIRREQLRTMGIQTQFDFGGSTYCPELDQKRLNTALGKAYTLMKDGKWRTLKDIANFAECSEAGASARIRDFRKERFAVEFGVRMVESRRKQGSDGTWEYRISVQ